MTTTVTDKLAAALRIALAYVEAGVTDDAQDDLTTIREALAEHDAQQASPSDDIALLLSDIAVQASTGIYQHEDDTAFFADGRITDGGVRERILIERAVIRQAVESAIAADLTIRVHDGGAWAGQEHNTVRGVMAELMSTDTDVLYFYQQGRKLGYLVLIYGNDGWDVMNDYTVGLAGVLTAARELADRIGDVR